MSETAFYRFMYGILGCLCVLVLILVAVVVRDFWRYVFAPGVCS